MYHLKIIYMAMHHEPEERDRSHISRFRAKIEEIAGNKKTQYFFGVLLIIIICFKLLSCPKSKTASHTEGCFFMIREFCYTFQPRDVLLDIL